MRGGEAFTSPDQILSAINPEHAGKQLEESPYTLWQLMDHRQVALWNILEFSRNPDHQSPEWPLGYWPEEKAPASPEELDSCRKAIFQGLDEMARLVQDKSNDLFSPFPHGTGQNLLRETLLVIEHNAYHLGQMVILLRLSGTWE